MQDQIALGLFIIIFLGLGIALNNFAEMVYWMWVDWSDRDKDR